MAMTERAYTYETAQSYELRRMRLLDGTAARERANRRRGDIVKITVGIVAVLVYLLGVTFMQAQIGSAAHEINQLKAAIIDTGNLSAQADLEIGRKSSLNHIEAYASGQLGMVYPAADQMYYLDEQSSLSIALGREQAAVLAESQPMQEEHALWRNIGATLENFFLGSALAAEE